MRIRLQPSGTRAATAGDAALGLVVEGLAHPVGKVLVGAGRQPNAGLARVGDQVAHVESVGAMPVRVRHAPAGAVSGIG